MCFRWHSSCTMTLSRTSRGASISRQLKFRFPLVLQLPQRVRWQRIVIRPYETPRIRAKYATRSGMSLFASCTRVRNVLVGGEPLDPEKTYKLASHDYQRIHPGFRRKEFSGGFGSLQFP